MTIEQIREYLKSEIDNYIDSAPQAFSNARARQSTKLDHVNAYLHFLAELIHIQRTENERETRPCDCADVVRDNYDCAIRCANRNIERLQHLRVND
jgi:hypothetical protein